MQESKSFTSSWSHGTAITKSTRFAAEEEKLKVYGVKKAIPPFSGYSFMRSFIYTSSKLSISDVLVTDEEWTAGRASTFIVKGTVDADIVDNILREEEDGSYRAVRCIIDGHEKALASVWVNEIHDSVCGKYHEYVVSFDVSKNKAIIAFDNSKVPAAYACWYNNFANCTGAIQYLQSLYIDSPLSITWGREMQAFPKHPEPVKSSISMTEKHLSCAISWKDDATNTPLLKVSTERVFGVTGFVRQGVGLLRQVGLVSLLRFLMGSSFRTGVLMPKATAEKSGVQTDYSATLWKGLNPTAVVVWPWNSQTDSFELISDSTKPTGCETNNGLAVLKKAEFSPLSVCNVPKLSAVVMKS